MRQEAKKWLKKAESDLDSAEYNFKGKKLDVAAFYSQQAAEKALKALQIEMHGKFNKIHDLLTLAESVKSPAEIKNSCSVLTPFYTLSGILM
ncbi:MAG: HEPN domain-containing protein [Candidatus Aenigmarchaeota archaeon]|nr:HEPN domain-containing protein [Candidatus Aenigmarchaeota archaeon]